MKVIKTLGFLSASFYLGTFSILFLINETISTQIENISVSAYNFEGMPQRKFINIFGYLLPGLLSAIFSFLLKNKFNKSSVSRIGAILLMISGLFWFSLGIYKYDPNQDYTLMIHFVQISICLLTGVAGLILLTVNIDQLTNQKFIKFITLVCGLLLIIEIFYSLKTEYSGIIASISWTIYFLWFMIFSIALSHRKINFVKD